MPGSATLGANLVDSLVGVVDDLRGDLHPAMGVRHWRAFTVTRSFPSGEPGDGTFSDVETEILPQPLVDWGLSNRVEPAGLNESGDCTLTEISLTYTEAELVGAHLGDGQQFFWVLREGHGQAMKDRYFTVKEPPHPDRVKTIGWVIKLFRQQIEGC
jgi:hypothetical protein